MTTASTTNSAVTSLVRDDFYAPHAVELTKMLENPNEPFCDLFKMVDALLAQRASNVSILLSADHGDGLETMQTIRVPFCTDSDANAQLVFTVERQIEAWRQRHRCVDVKVTFCEPSRYSARLQAVITVLGYRFGTPCTTCGRGTGVACECDKSDNPMVNDDNDDNDDDDEDEDACKE